VGIGGDDVTLWFDDLATIAAASSACALCLRARRDGHLAMRRFWSLLSAATASWAGAEIIWAAYDLALRREVPIPSPADIGYLGAIPLSIAALLVHPATRSSGLRGIRRMFDGTLAATALLFISWVAVLGPLWRSNGPGTWEGLVSLAYPFGDVVMIFFVVLAISAMTGATRRYLWCLFGGLLVMALTDSTYSYLTSVHDYTSGDVLDGGWVAAYLGVALAAFSGADDDAEPLPAPARRVSQLSLAAPLVLVLLAMAVATLEIKLGGELDTVTWVVMCALFGQVLIRQALAAIEFSTPGPAAPARA
jgi:hypothetical protein